MASAAASASPLGKGIDICKDEKRRAKERAAKLRLLLQLNYIREETVVVVVAVYCSGRRIEFGVPCSSSSSMIAAAAADAAFHCLRGQRQQQQQQPSKLDGWMHCSCCCCIARALARALGAIIAITLSPPYVVVFVFVLFFFALSPTSAHHQSLDLR